MTVIRRLVMAGVLSGLPLAAHAGTCTLDPGRAYEVALRKGWTFNCVRGVLHFDGAKRPGCSTKTVAATEEVQFFSNHSFPHSGNGALANGWRLKSYEVIGGEWNRFTGSSTPRIQFWYKTNLSRQHRRYVSKIVVEHATASCKAVYRDAFG